LFNKTISDVSYTLWRAELWKSDIDDVILIGGSTRIPKIQQRIRDFFGGKQLLTMVNPDQAVVHGAALWASRRWPAIMVDMRELNPSIEIDISRMPVTYTSPVPTPGPPPLYSRTDISMSIHGGR
jgi:molecular chaperone DnaK (HSP70)